jgi:cell division transport system ATP-binding protein
MNDARDAAPMIRFAHVGMRYGIGPEILRDLTFAIAPCSFQFLTGPSGAGKSTLLKLIMLSLRPTRGVIEMYGSNVARMSETELTMVRRKTGVVFQEFRLLDHLTTFENVALPMRVQGRSEASGLGDRMHVLPPVLSGGEKQRAAIARALIAKPEFLIADEPTGNVDPTLARRLLRLFVELHRLGTAIIIATHDYSLMEQFEARRMVLGDGRLNIEEPRP